MSTLVVAEAAGFILAGLALIRLYLVRSWGSCDSRARFDGKTVIISGGNGGIGKATAQELVNRGANVIIACRDEESALSAVNEINERKSTNCGSITYKHLDLNSFKSVLCFAEDVVNNVQEVHVLVNNAGAYNAPFQITEDGFEANFSTNHLGHALLTVLLFPKLIDSGSTQSPSRVLFVSSMLYKFGTVRDSSFVPNAISREKFRGFKPYADSKLTFTLFARQLAKECEQRRQNVQVVLASPGIVYTNLARHVRKAWHAVFFAPIAFCFLRTPAQGSQTILRCILEQAENGAFYRNCKKVEFIGPARDEKIRYWVKQRNACGSTSVFPQTVSIQTDLAWLHVLLTYLLVTLVQKRGSQMYKFGV